MDTNAYVAFNLFAFIIVVYQRMQLKYIFVKIISMNTLDRTHSYLLERLYNFIQNKKENYAMLCIVVGLVSNVHSHTANIR